MDGAALTVERFNGRIQDLPLSHHFRSGEDLKQFILRHLRLCNGQPPQFVLTRRTPIDALKDRQRHRAQLFGQRAPDRAGCDS